MKAFVYDALPGRIVFGTGSLARLSEEVDRLGTTRILLAADPTTEAVAREAERGLGHRVVGTFTDIQLHVPEAAAEQAVAAAREAGADAVVTIGGGSTTGFGKAIALQTGIPLIAVPTTYAGSEMTPIYGITSDGLKRTSRDLLVLPRTVIYDPVLTITLPASVTASSGMNAMAHSVEALYAREANPITSLVAEEGIRALARGIPASVRRPSDIDARSDALYGAYLAGAALAVVGMALHHRICHVLGGTFGLAHAEANAVILPHVVRFNEPAAPEAMSRVARALGSEDAASALFEFAEGIGSPRTLAELGLHEEDLAAAARLTVETPYWNPRPATEQDVLGILAAAFREQPRVPASIAREVMPGDAS
jgi:maleylacetate reductase